MPGLVWWLWTAFEPAEVHIYNVAAAWRQEDPDVRWLGECAWTARADNSATGLVSL
jgi:hypothetical protein